MSSSSAVRFAFVGCGGIARHHLRALRGTGHAAQIAAVVDVKRDNAEEFAKLIPEEQSTADCQVGGACWQIN